MTSRAKKALRCKIAIYILLIPFMFFWGCTSLTLETSFHLIEDQASFMKTESDPDLARLAIPAQLKILEDILKSKPSGLGLRRLLEKGYCGYSFAFLEDDNRDRAGQWYLRGKNYESEALQRLTGKAKFSKGDTESWESSLNALDAEALLSLYCLTQCWGGWLTMNMINPFADISRIEPALKRVSELDENYFYGGPDRVLGFFTEVEQNF